MCHPSMVRVVLMSLPKWRVVWTQRSFQVGIKFLNLYKCLCFLRLSMPFSVRLVWLRFDSWQGSWSMLQHATTCYAIYSEPSLFLQASKIGAHTICSTCRRSHPQPVAFQLCHCWFRRVFKEKCLFRLHLNLWCFLACPSSAEFAFGFWFLVIWYNMFPVWCYLYIYHELPVLRCTLIWSAIREGIPGSMRPSSRLSHSLSWWELNCLQCLQHVDCVCGLREPRWSWFWII